MTPTNYANADQYTNVSFWQKVKSSSRKAGRSVLEKALTLFYSAKDKDTPKWAKSIMLGALAYFILPVDAIPDFIPVVGFSDDFFAIMTALGVVAVHVKQEHKDKAMEISESIFGKI